MSMLFLQVKFRLPLILLIIFTTLASCRKPANTALEKGQTTFPKQLIAYLALGDSYTIGQGVKADETYAAQTVALLHKEDLNIDTLEILAATGYTTTDLQNRINNTRLQRPYRFVSLAIGVNDQYQLQDTLGFRKRFSQLLQSAISVALKRSAVFVLPVPDYSVTPFARYYNHAEVSRQIDNFNRIIRDVTELNRCVYINVTPLSREAAQHPELLCADSLHYSKKMYAKWASLLAGKMREEL